MPRAAVSHRHESHPAISAVALVGLPDPLLGERSCAVLVTDGTALQRRDLAQFLTARGLAAYKIPDRVVIRSNLPHTGVGKINKRLLRDEISNEI